MICFVLFVNDMNGEYFTTNILLHIEIDIVIRDKKVKKCAGFTEQLNRLPIFLRNTSITSILLYSTSIESP